MNIEEYKKLFQLVAKTESGEPQRLEELEQRLLHLREGKALSYKDLEIIADGQYWPFSKYWMWPAKDQIEKALSKTEGLFKDLPKDETKNLKIINGIFKNIALVSIVLRFARPDEYAIYSCPVLQILRIKRGANEVDDYLIYINEMRILKGSFRVDKTSEVDKIVWAIARLKGKYAEDLKTILAKQLPDNLTAAEIINHLYHNPLKIARIYYKQDDHFTAGLWASKAFEKFIYEECHNHGIYIIDEAYQRAKMIYALSKDIPIWKIYANKQLLYETKNLRNKIVPGVKVFTRTDVEEFIRDIEILMSISDSQCRQ